MQVFLSYARADATAEADLLRKHLDNTLVHSWVDRHDLAIGENWWPNVRKAIVASDTFALLITPGSVASNEVKREYSLALELKKDFVPLLVKPAVKPPQIDLLQHIDLTGTEYTNGVTRLSGRLSQRSGELRSKLQALYVEPVGAAGWTSIPGELIPTVKALEEHTRSKVRPPEVFLAFCATLSQLRDRNPAMPLVDAIEDILARNSVPAEWAPVFNEHRSYFTGLLTPLRDSLRPQRTGRPVSVVLIVMNKQEARELASEAAFIGSPQEVSDQFKEFNLPADWTDAYGDTPESWIPYPGSATIGEQIKTHIQTLAAAGKPLYADFIDIRTLDKLPFTQLRKLRYEGCLVVMDVLSIFHPKLHQAYLRSMLCAQEKALLVQMLPWQAFPDLKDVAITFRKRLDLEFWERYESSDNCRQIGRAVDLKRFLEGELPTTSGVFAFIHPQ